MKTKATLFGALLFAAIAMLAQLTYASDVTGKSDTLGIISTTDAKATSQRDPIAYTAPVVYDNGLEVADGFTADLSCGQSDMFELGLSAIGFVRTVDPFSGSQHMMIESNNAQDGTNGCLSGDVTVTDNCRVEARAVVKPEGNINGAGSDFWFQPQDPADGLLTTILRFTFEGNILGVNPNNGSAVFQTIGTYSEGEWMTVRIVADPNNSPTATGTDAQLQYYVDGTFLAGSPFWAGDSIENIFIGTDNFGGTFKVDDLVIEEFCTTAVELNTVETIEVGSASVLLTVVAFVALLGGTVVVNRRQD